MAGRNIDLRVKELMARDVVCVHPEDPLREALALMFENRVSAVPVVDKRERCKGILSTTDLVGLLFGRQAEPAGGEEPADLADFPADLAEAGRPGSRLGDRLVGEVMTRSVITVSLEDTVLAAAREMARNRVHRLVVIDPQQRVIGILSTMDLIEAFAAETP